MLKKSLLNDESLNSIDKADVGDHPIDIETTALTRVSNPHRFISWIASKFTPGSIKGSVFELIGATMGAGVLLMPYTCYASGLAFSIFQMMICAGLSYYSAMLLAKCADMCHKYDYFDVATATYGIYIQYLVKLVFFINNWGCCVVYTILITNFIGTSLSIFFPNHELAQFLTDPNSLFWPPLFTTIVILPLALQRDLSALRYACLIGFGFILYLGAVIIYQSFTIVDFSANLSRVDNFKITGLGITFPTAIFSYSYHPNVLYVYEELQRPSYLRIRKVLIRSMVIACAVFITLGAFGYIIFADNPSQLVSKHNILFSFAYKGWPTSSVIALFLVGLCIILIMPLSLKPAKEALEELIFSERNRGNHSVQKNSVGEEIIATTSLEPTQSNLRHILLVVIVVYSQMLVGMFVKSMAQVIQVLGATTISMMCFNFPCMFYLKLDKSIWHSPHRLVAHVVNISMFLVGLYSLYDTITS